jgi:hypothetical protein
VSCAETENRNRSIPFNPGKTTSARTTLPPRPASILPKPAAAPGLKGDSLPNPYFSKYLTKAMPKGSPTVLNLFRL